MSIKTAAEIQEVAIFLAGIAAISGNFSFSQTISTGTLASYSGELWNFL